MDLIGITAQLAFVDGVLQDLDAVPGLLSQMAAPKSARGREHDFLFAHLSLTGDPAEAMALADEFMARLSREYFHSTGSVTAALRRAVLDLNEALLYYNVQNRRDIEGALTTSVLHGDELYTLQAGEGLAYLGHNFGVERLPAQTRGVPTPLGRSAGLDIRFAYHKLQIGDMLLLADPRLASLNGTTLAPVLVDSEIESALEALNDALGDDTARVLLVEFADEVPASLPVRLMPPTKKQAARARPRPPAAPVAAAGAAVAVTATNDPTAEAPPAAPPPLAAAGPKRDPGLPPLRTPTPMVAPAVPASVVVETKARQAAATSARGLSGATAWLAGMLDQLHPETEEEEEAGGMGWAIPTILAIVIPIIISAVVLSVYAQRGNVAELGQVKQDMVEQLLVAEGQAADPAAQRTAYAAVLSLAETAETMHPGDGEVERMRFEAREGLDRLDDITRLTAVPFSEFGDEAALSNIALRTTDDAGYFVLDRAANQTWFRGTDRTYDNTAPDEDEVVAAGGQAVGDKVLGTVVDLIWITNELNEERSGVTILDRTGVLFQHYANYNDTRATTLGLSSTWLNPVAISSFADRIYVLDSGAGQIWRYDPLGEGYTQSTENAAVAAGPSLGLQAATDFDFYDADGSLVVVYSDGRILYYDTVFDRTVWDEKTLAANGLAAPLVSPTRVNVVGNGLNASVFVLDPPTNRLLQISRGGTVLAQYRVLDDQSNELLGQAADFAVSESPFRLLFTVGNKVYRASR